MHTHLVISALGQDKPGLVHTLTKEIFNHDCNINDSRMTVLGGEFAIIIAVSGSADNISRLDHSLASFTKAFNLNINTRKTTAKTKHPDHQLYAIEVLSLDHPGIVQQLASFFSSNEVNIDDLTTGCYAAPHTGSPMFSVTMKVALPISTKMSEIKEQFLSFCDELNLDASIDAIQN